MATTIISSITTNTTNTPVRQERLDPTFSIEIYADETFTFDTSIDPFFRDREFLQTHNEDFDFTEDVAYTFDVSVHSVVYICVDPAMTVLPAWLNDGLWQLYGLEAPTTNSDKVYKIYWKEFTPGTVSLGGNAQSPSAGATENYLIIVKPFGRTQDTFVATNFSVYSESQLTSYITATTERIHIDGLFDYEFAITSIPAAYVGLLGVRTSNRDGPIAAVEDYISFDVIRNIRVFVGLDNSAPSLPTWVDGTWTDSGHEIEAFAVDATKTFRLYYKNFEQERVVLGSHRDTAEVSMGDHYIIILKPFDLPQSILFTDALVTGVLYQEQTKRCNYPGYQVTIEVPGELVIDLTPYVMQIPIIDRKRGVLPNDYYSLTQTDGIFKLANIGQLFSPQSPQSIFYGKDYFDAKITVYAGFYSSVAELLPDCSLLLTTQLVVFLQEVRVNTEDNSVDLACRGVASKVDRIKIGEPTSEGVAAPLVYTGEQSFQAIIEDLLETHGGLATTEFEVANAIANFTDLTFTDVGLIEAIESMCQITFCSFYEDRKGRLVIKSFTPEFGGVDVKLVSEQSNITRLQAIEDVNLLLKKVSVTGPSIYSEDAEGHVKGQVISIDNDYIQDSTQASAIATTLIGQWGVVNPLVEIDMTYWPTLDVGEVIHVQETQSGIANLEYQIYRVQLDLKSYRVVAYGIRSDLGKKFAFVGSMETEETDPNAPQNLNFAAASDYDKNFVYTRDEADATEDQPYYVYGRR